MLAIAAHENPPIETTEIIPSVSFEALLANRDAAVACLAAIARAVKDYGEIGDTLKFVKGDYTTSAGYKYRDAIETLRASRGPLHLTDTGWLTHATASVDAALWDHLLEESGLRTFMDAKAREDWDKQIEKNETPPLTPDNIRATFAHLHAQRREFFERGVIALFRSLSFDYKTNRPQAFGKKLILTYVLDSYGHPVHRQADTLDDLLRAMHLLDGKPEPDHRNGVRPRLYARRSGPEKDADLLDDYLSIRTFKNGNAHVTFLRQDLVDELNRILARHYPDALPAARDAA